jgi:ankyrin
MATSLANISLLFEAVVQGDVDKVRVLLECDESAYCNNINSNGGTPLHYACGYGHLGMVRMLVSEFKADVTVQCPEGITPLMAAVFRGHESVVRAMVCNYNCPIDVHMHSVGYTALHLACQRDDVGIVRILMNAHQDGVYAQDNSKDTPLHMAAFNGQADVTLCLLKEFNCDPNLKGNHDRILLHDACEGGNVHLVRTLILNYEADVNAQDNNNDTPLTVAAICGKAEVVLCLILMNLGVVFGIINLDRCCITRIEMVAFPL